MNRKDKIVSFETAKLLKKKGFVQIVRRNLVAPAFFMPTYDDKGEYGFREKVFDYYPAPDKCEVQDWLRKFHKILVIVDYCYECTDTSYFYKIFKFSDKYGKPERVTVELTYSEGNTHRVFSDYKRSYKDYKHYSDAFEEGLQAALEMIPDKEFHSTEIIGEIAHKEGCILSGVLLKSDTPDKNGRVYSEEALINAVDNFNKKLDKDE